MTFNSLAFLVFIGGFAAAWPLVRGRSALRMQGEDQTVQTDESGRFVADNLREGFVQLVFHPLDGEDTDDGGGLVVTPLFKL